MPRRLTYTVAREQDGLSLRDFARRTLGFSARVLAEQKRTPGGILRNSVPCRAREALHAGDEIVFTLPEERGAYLPVEGPLSVLWETEDFLAVDKPAAMPVHPSRGHDTDSLLNAVAFYDRQAGRAGVFRPLYRLDRDTSGVILLARHRVAAGAALEKTYYAVCQGELEGAGAVDVPIGLAPGSKILRECGHGEPAVTHWRALVAREGHTLLALRLETGRTHQIRVHLAWMGHPLAGDDLYGGSREKVSRQALHCGRLRVDCPALHVNQRILSDIPPDLRAAFPWLPGPEELWKEDA